MGLGLFFCFMGGIALSTVCWYFIANILMKESVKTTAEETQKLMRTMYEQEMARRLYTTNPVPVHIAEPTPGLGSFDMVTIKDGEEKKVQPVRPPVRRPTIGSIRQSMEQAEDEVRRRLSNAHATHHPRSNVAAQKESTTDADEQL